MPIQVTRTLYMYDELSDKAKEKARDWYREYHGGDMWVADIVTDEFKEELKTLGYPTDTVEWRLGHCQGDGMAFYGKCDVDALIKRLFASPGKLLLEHADKLSIEIERNSWGHHYSHWNTMCVAVEHDDCRNTATNSELLTAIETLYDVVKEDVQSTSRRLEKLGYKTLDYCDSDEFIEEELREHEYTFRESGKQEDA